MGRLRTNPNATKLILESNYLIDKKTKKLFPKDQPIYLEIGMGKGNFIIENAITYPKINFIGLEKYSTVILKAIKKIEASDEKITNLKIIYSDAKEVKDYLNKKVEKIYLNFSDPWPKKRHEQKRLTSPTFREIYKKILIKNGVIEFKTDNDGLFEYTKESLENDKKVKVICWTRDLYSELGKKTNRDNIPTEYEKKFCSLGLKIKKITWYFI